LEAVGLDSLRVSVDHRFKSPIFRRQIVTSREILSITLKGKDQVDDQSCRYNRGEDMMNRGRVVLVLGVLISLIVCSPAVSQEFSSCIQIAGYLYKNINKDSFYVRISKLENAINLIESQKGNIQEKCDDGLTERTLFQFAQSKEEYSNKFRKGDEGRKNWSVKAAKEYRNYLDWFLGLPVDRQDSIICKLADGCDPKAPNFNEKRTRLLRFRIGAGVLKPMGDCYVKAGQPEQMIYEYGNCFNTYNRPDIFPDEAVAQWHQLLRTQPPFNRDLDEQGIRTFINNNSECKQRWVIFRSFLQAYIATISPGFEPQKNNWQNEDRRIAEWLSSS
jgi:hypothetical protein